jgi:MutS domain V
MKAHLLYRSRDFDWKWALHAAAEREARRTGRRSRESPPVEPQSAPPWNAEALTRDLGLTTLLNAMAGDDECVFEVARMVLLAGVQGNLETIRYRQAILRDCLDHPEVVRALYAVAVEAMQKPKGGWYGLLSHSADSVLRDAIEAMATFLEYLRKLRQIADVHAGEFASEGWSEFFATLRRDLGDEYLTLVQEHLEDLKFRNGELLSAELGKANKGRRYVLHRVSVRWWTWGAWLAGLFEEKPPGYSFELHPRDEAGHRALGALRNRGIALAANALGQSADHVREFFGMLRTELAFYVGCLNLHEALARKGEPTCMPVLTPAEAWRWTCRGLYDVGLTLSVEPRVVGNDVNADRRTLVVITGPNTGGKSTFLRSVGLAQLMMQCGMFAPAEFLGASLCDGLVTHCKREEDVRMERGKFDEELSRMSDILDQITSRCVILFNESFAATNEREGSEIARQIVRALLESGVRVFFVTHMFDLAHGFYVERSDAALFLRAERQADGRRTFRMVEGAPLPTSYGEDVYRRIFGTRAAPAGRAAASVQRGVAAGHGPPP